MKGWLKCLNEFQGLKNACLILETSQRDLRSENVKQNNRVNVIENEIAFKLSILDQNMFGFPERITKLDRQIGQGTSFIFGYSALSNEL